MTMYQTSGSYDLPPGKSFTEGEKLTITFNNKRNVPERVASIWETGKTNHMYHFVITIVYRTGTKVWVPQTTWTESCGFDKKSALSSAVPVPNQAALVPLSTGRSTARQTVAGQYTDTM
jgi:conjugal transfer mating pair stabilization protein TraN